jgi:hypothetical protein
MSNQTGTMLMYSILPAEHLLLIPKGATFAADVRANDTMVVVLVFP